MKIYDKELKRAFRWLSAGKNQKVTKFLQPKVPLFRENPNFYAILGRACMEQGRLKDARDYLECGLKISPEHLDIRLVLAVTELKCKNSNSAIKIWMSILKDYKKEAHAKRGLNIFKKFTDKSSEDRFLNTFNPHRFLPDISEKWPLKLFLLLLIILAIFITLYFRTGLSTIFDNLQQPRRSRSGAGYIETLRTNLVDDDMEARYAMTEAEASRTLKRALRFFEKYQDNSARFELNKIINSNVTSEVLRQSILMLGILEESEFDTLETDFSLADVMENPWLYDGCWVLWSGVTANVSFEEQAIGFDFLVGYDQGEVLEGRVPVKIPFLTVMEPLPLELLAKISYDGKSVTLIGKTLHFIR